MHGIDVPVAQHRHASFDGTALTYDLAGNGPRRMVLASGLGTPVLAWKFIVERFADEVAVWNRGEVLHRGTPDDVLSRPDVVRDVIGEEI